jgi:hypothetical protein
MPTISDTDLDAIYTAANGAVEAEFVIDPEDEDANITVLGFYTYGSDKVLMYGVEVEAVEPSFTCKTPAIAAVRNKMTVTIASSSRTVERVQKIGNGTSVVYLKTA